MPCLTSAVPCLRMLSSRRASVGAAGEPVQGGAPGARWLGTAPFPRPGRGWPRRPLATVGERLQRGRAVPIACGDFLVIDFLQGHRWGQRAQRLGAPMALQGAGDGALVVL